MTETIDCQSFVLKASMRGLAEFHSSTKEINPHCGGDAGVSLELRGFMIWVEVFSVLPTDEGVGLFLKV